MHWQNRQTFKWTWHARGMPSFVNTGFWGGNEAENRLKTEPRTPGLMNQHPGGSSPIMEKFHRSEFCRVYFVSPRLTAPWFPRLKASRTNTSELIMQKLHAEKNKAGDSALHCCALWTKWEAINFPSVTLFERNFFHLLRSDSSCLDTTFLLLKFDSKFNQRLVKVFTAVFVCSIILVVLVWRESCNISAFKSSSIDVWQVPKITVIMKGSYGPDSYAMVSLHVNYLFSLSHCAFGRSQSFF